MKINKILTASILAVAMLCVFTSCNDDDQPLSKAVMVSSSALYFSAEGGSQTVTVYSDAVWITDIPDWVSVTPDTGYCTTEVTISVPQNYTDGEADLPRSATLVFKGGTLASMAEMTVNQDGDAYKGVAKYTVAEVYELVDNAVLSLPNVIVAGLSVDGFVVGDADFANFVFVTTDEEVSIGDEVSVVGDKTSNYRLPFITPYSCTLVSTGNAVTYPTATDITAEVDTYSARRWNYVCVTGTLDMQDTSYVLRIEGAVYGVNILNAANFSLDSLLGSTVTVSGFYSGTSSPYIRIIATDIN